MMLAATIAALIGGPGLALTLLLGVVLLAKELLAQWGGAARWQRPLTLAALPLAAAAGAAFVLRMLDLIGALG